jgi:hypothetical protein
MQEALREKKRPQLEEIVSTEQAVLSIPAADGGKPLTYDLPLQGLAPAVATLRRMDKVYISEAMKAAGSSQEPPGSSAASPAKQ